jgi:hypothetical protein
LVGNRSRAELRSIERSNETAQVRLADIQWSWDSSGESRGVAAFDLDPAGATTCDLQLPEDQHLVQAQLDAVPAQLSPVGENRWTVWLGDNKLPRHLEVIFASDRDTTGATRPQFAAPSLVDLPVERTLWSIASPIEAGPASQPSGTSITPLRHLQLRLAGAAASVDAASNLLLDETSDDVARWYVPWSRRFAASRADLVAAKSAASPEEYNPATDAELNAVDQEQAKLTKKLNASNPEAQSPQPSIVSDWLHLAAAQQSSNHRLTFAMTHGDAAPLQVEYPERAVVSVARRYFVAALVALLTIALIVALRFTRLSNVHVSNGPQWLGLSIGVLWWLWLTPAIVGVAIIAASIFSLWHARRVQPVQGFAAP